MMTSLNLCQLSHVKHFETERFHKTYIPVTTLAYHSIFHLVLSFSKLFTSLLHSHTEYNEIKSYYLPSNDLSLIITDSSNFIIRVVPLCQCAVTFAGYNQKEKWLLIIRKLHSINTIHCIIIIYHFKLCF